jgi:2-succinyl-6-hydroxy-2,4-cyclohexadiene-1-carboxylate synthase
MYAELADLLGNEVLAPDLPGHGRSADYPATFRSAVMGVREVLVAMGPPAPLIGYSQGGRVAVGVALDRPDLVSRLVLVSAAPGIEDDLARTERQHAEEDLAGDLREESLAEFVDRWLSRPMFHRLDQRGAAWQATDRAARLENTAAGLAAALVGMGQGAQPYLGDRLAELAMPVLVIAGELDPKYVTLARAMCRTLPNAVLTILPATGHAVIGEQPGAVAELIETFLDRLE